MSFITYLINKFKKKTIKKEIRIIGIDDAPFSKTKKGNVLTVGTIFRGGQSMEGLLSTHIEVDGSNSTEKLVQMVNNTKHKPQLQVIMTDGIALGGFNVIDIHELSKRTKLPVIVVMRNYPNFEKLFKAIENVSGSNQKKSLIKRAGEIYEVDLETGKIFIQLVGLRPEEARQIIKIAATRGLMPEPIRLAHLIASGIVEGESRGRA